MIVDTTYLLPLTRIGVDTDLLRAIDKGRISINFDKLAISSISIFELQAKAAKLNVSADFTNEAIEVINTVFRIEPFYSPKVVKISSELLDRIKDYIDCIITSTAIALDEDLITEDSKIIGNKKFIKEKYKIDVMSYKELIGSNK